MKAPLQVSLHGGARQQNLRGEDVTGLSFTKVANGGQRGGSMRINRPRSEFPDLSPADRGWIDDDEGRVFDLFTENPGEIDGPSGQGFDLAFMGPEVLANDESRPHLYIDKNLDDYEQYRAGSDGAISANAGSSDDPEGTLGDGLLLQFPPGQPIGTGSGARAGRLMPDGLEFGAVGVTIRSGKADADYQVSMAHSGGGVGASATILSTSLFTGTLTGERWVVDDVTEGRTAISFNLTRLGGATNITGDDTWTFVADLSLLARRMDRFGVLKSGAAGMESTTHVLAHQVIEDLLGRVLTVVDPLTAQVDPATFEIDQLAYTEGATCRQLLDDLTEIEPDYTWAMGSKNARGYQFDWRAWPTDPRYVISTSDGYEMTGSDFDLCNRIAVYWTDAKGVAHTTVVTATSADYPALSALEAVGRTKDAEPITLEDGRGSEAIALRIGQAVLAAKAEPPKAARATVTGMILDLLTGRMVPPWRILPGYMVRVAETGHLLRLTEMTYNDDTVSTDLTLGEPVLSEGQIIARMAVAS